MENAQATLTTHGNGDNYLLGEDGASNSYNTTADLLVQPIARHHCEGRIRSRLRTLRSFRHLDRFTDRVFPLRRSAWPPRLAEVRPWASPPPSEPITLPKKAAVRRKRALEHCQASHASARKAFSGSGIGRYGPGGLADASINGNGTLHLIKNSMGLGTLELHLTKKLDFDGYAGVEYACANGQLRSSGKSGAGAAVGYGSPNSSTLAATLRRRLRRAPPTALRDSIPVALRIARRDTRALIEGTGEPLVQVLLRTSRQLPLRHAVLLRDPQYMVGCRRRSTRNRQHDLHVVPLLLAVSEQPSEGRLPLGIAAGPVLAYSPFPGRRC